MGNTLRIGNNTKLFKYIHGKNEYFCVLLSYIFHNMLVSDYQFVKINREEFVIGVASIGSLIAS